MTLLGIYQGFTVSYLDPITSTSQFCLWLAPKLLFLSRNVSEGAPILLSVLMALPFTLFFDEHFKIIYVVITVSMKTGIF